VSDSYRYRKLGYLALNVSDLDRSVAFYRDHVGLELVARAGSTAFLRCSGQHHELALFADPSTQPGIKRIAFELESAAELDRAQQALAALDVLVEPVPAAECAALHVQRAIRYRVPDSELPFELYVAMEQPATPFVPTVAQFDRLGHIVLQVKNWQTSVDWLMENANFKASDHVEGWFTFLRCFPNPYHHSLGIGRSDRTHLHHFCFLVKTVDDIGRAINRCKRANVPISFGPGRHVASTSIFLYFDDPDGMTLEYSFGMETFAEVGPRPPRHLEPKLETVDEWGGIPVPGYASVGLIEGAAV
jgi:2,3-dihydroxy-p-cumate/2,3-dihydroxybenzoate 3,4-dioxygenase